MKLFIVLVSFCLAWCIEMKKRAYFTEVNHDTEIQIQVMQGGYFYLLPVIYITKQLNIDQMVPYF